MRIALPALLALALLASCARHPRPRPVSPPFKPPVQVSPPPRPFELTEAPPEILWLESPFPFEFQFLVLQPLPPPPKPRVTPAVVAQPQPEPALTPSPGLQLRPLLTPAQARELERQINDRIARARAILRSVENKRLTREQAAVASQVRTFIEQAEAVRHADLPRASNLAERAEVLAADLSRQLSR